MASRARRRDSREFVIVAVDLPTHRKLAELDDPAPAGWLYVAGLCHAGQNLTDGIVAERAVIGVAGVTRQAADELVEVGLWHRPGHACERCPQPSRGSVVVHDYLEHNRSREDAERAREQGRRGAAARWGGAPVSTNYAVGNADSNADSNAQAQAEVQAQVEAPLLTIVSRLAGGNASASNPPPAEQIAAWSERAGGADLEAEARSYLAHYADRPAKNERAAWHGWLDQAARRAGAPTAPIPKRRKPRPAEADAVPLETGVRALRAVIPGRTHNERAG